MRNTQTHCVPKAECFKFETNITYTYNNATDTNRRKGSLPLKDAVDLCAFSVTLPLTILLNYTLWPLLCGIKLRTLH